MRKTLLSLSLCAAVGASALTPGFKWGRQLFNDNRQSTISAVEALADGTFYIAGTYKTAPTVYWGEDLMTGLAEAKAANDGNLIVMHLKNDGSADRVIYSTAGNFGSPVAVGGNDGSLTVAALVRRDKSSTDTRLATIVDAGGKTSDIDGDDDNGLWRYYAIVFKADADGSIKWIKRISQSTVYDTQSGVTSSMSLDALTVGDDGDVFIGGRYLTALTLPGDVTVPAGLNAPAKLSASLTGGGDSWIARLDGDDGTTTAVYYGGLDNDRRYAVSDAVKGLAAVGDKLYFVNLVQGTGSTAGFAGKDVELSTFQQPVYGSLTLSGSEFSADHVTAVAPEANSAGKVVVQINGFGANDNGMWLAGALNGGLDLGDKSIASKGTALGGFFIKASATDGAVTAAGIDGDAVDTKTISAIYSLVNDTENDNTYGFGYMLGEGLAVWTFGSDAKEATDPIVLIGSDGGMAGIPAASFDNTGKNLIAAVRTNKPARFYGSDFDLPHANNAFTATAALFSVPDLDNGQTGIADINADDRDEPTEYYNLQGIRVVNPAGGLYIRRQGNRAAKVIIR